MHINYEEVRANAKQADHVLYGPWVGEFGWELFSCQGYLRKLKEDNPHLKSFHIISRTGRSFLYQDFCDSYIEYDCPGKNTTGALCIDYRYDNFHKKVINKLNLKNCLWIPTQTFLVDYHADGEGREPRLSDFLNHQKFIKYTSNSILNSPYDILIHARESFHHDTGNKNWSKDKWDKVTEYLSNKGYRLAATGSKTGAYAPKHCDDIRGIDLSEDISYLNQCKFLISTCSGPAHLASLCNTPLVVITNENNINRYKTDWNPFNTPREIVYEEGWNPSVDLVISKIEKML